MVTLGADGLRDERVAPVRADHDSRALDDRLAAVVMAADAHHDAVLDQDLFDREPLPNFSTRACRSVDQDLVEHPAPRGIGVRRAAWRRARSALDGDWPEVEGVGRHRGKARTGDLIQQPPTAQRRDRRRLHDVGRDGVARELGTVHDKHPVALPGQQHRHR
ncbi:MAG: hypothetical protein ABI808_06525 [Pseudonocardiales bacterium]